MDPVPDTTTSTDQTAPTAGTNPPAAQISTLRTFKSDVSGAMSGQNMTLASMALSEDRKRREQSASATSESNKTSIALVVSGILFVASCMLVVYALFIRETPQQGVVVMAPRDSIIYADGHTALPIDTFARPQQLIAAIGQKLLDTNRKIGSIEDIYFTRQSVEQYTDSDGVAHTRTVATELTSQDFLTTLNAHAPDRFARTIAPAFMYGIHAFGDNTGFLLFTTDSYDATYADMLAWEKRFLARDLAPILRPGGIPNGTNESNWQDERYKNIDNRVLRDGDGNLLLMYAFLNPTTLVVTSSKDAFSEILLRYTTPKPVVQ